MKTFHEWLLERKLDPTQDRDEISEPLVVPINRKKRKKDSDDEDAEYGTRRKRGKQTGEERVDPPPPAYQTHHGTATKRMVDRWKNKPTGDFYRKISDRPDTGLGSRREPMDMPPARTIGYEEAYDPSKGSWHLNNDGIIIANIPSSENIIFERLMEPCRKVV